MPLVLILRAHTTALVILNTLGMDLTVKVPLFSVMPIIFLELGLDRPLIHSSPYFKICHNYVNYVSCILNTRLCKYCLQVNAGTCQPSTGGMKN